MLEPQAIHKLFSHGSVFFGSRNLQKLTTKSDTSGPCLVYAKKAGQSGMKVIRNVTYNYGI